MAQFQQQEITAEELVRVLIQQAVRERVSDIHIEPLVDRMCLRFRVDGNLQDRGTRPLYELEPILTRMKVLSNLDITSHATPQEGHFEMTVDVGGGQAAAEAERAERSAGNLTDKLSSLFSKGGGNSLPPEPGVPLQAQQSTKRLIDVRLSIFPTIHGETAVLRLLNRAEMFMSIKDLGFDAAEFSIVKKIINKIYGMVLVTGPSGAGKTTTLYSILREIKSKEKNIITLEDPVEFHIDDIRQSQMNPDQGYTFAIGMRSILRQDPDVVMIGEIRDPETAEQAVRASLTGRIVFSTVHSNTTIGTIARLTDMNVERSLIAYAINGVIAQRLVRKMCQQCKTTYQPEAEYMSYFGLTDGQQTFLKGKGCSACDNTGYIGRVGIFEVLEFDDTIRSLIIDKAPMFAIQEYAEKNGMKTLKQGAIEKVLAGITTLEEAARTV